MKKEIYILYILVFIIAGWFAYICYRDLRFDADNSAGIIVSILGIMVALLIGWQIWQTMDIKDKIDKINNIEQSGIKMQDDIFAFKIYMDAENLMLRAFVNSHNNKKEESFDYIFDALYKYAEISYKDYAQATTIKVIADTIEFITEIPHIKQEYINNPLVELKS